MSTTASSGPQAALSLPKGGGAVKGIGETFQANLFSGTADYGIPIALSPARGASGPQLSLGYSSGNGNGVFGLGWQLTMPHVTRKTEKGLPRYDDGDVFVLTGAEDLVPYATRVVDPDSGRVDVGAGGTAPARRPQCVSLPPSHRRVVRSHRALGPHHHRRDALADHHQGQRHHRVR